MHGSMVDLLEAMNVTGAQPTGWAGTRSHWLATGGGPD
jgi:hypothetical protein